VIGCGPAGASAAITLARAKWRVTIIEARAFPRSKVCGEMISPAGHAALACALGWGDDPSEWNRRALAIGARIVHTICLQARVGPATPSRAAWRTSDPSWSIGRTRLDTLLRDAARSAGATIVQPATVRAVSYADDRVRVTLGDGRELEGAIVVHADGSGRHDPAGSVPHRRTLLGAKCHIALDAGTREDLRGRVLMCAAPGAYLGVVEIEGSLATCALVARTALVRAHDGDMDALARTIWPTLATQRREGPWLTCPVARSRFVEPGHWRSFRVGNAAGAVDPVGGEGIGLALWAGVALGRVLGGFSSRGHDAPGDDRAWLRRAGAALSGAYRARLRARRWACRAGAEALMRPRLARAALPAAGLLLGPWLRLIGKHADGAIGPGSGHARARA
jgi:flavin-dependent dehydrogenase